MQKETMTIHFALCEKKTLEKRIDKTIHELELVSVKEQCAKLVNGRTVKEFTDRAKKSEQKARTSTTPATPLTWLERIIPLQKPSGSCSMG